MNIRLASAPSVVSHVSSHRFRSIVGLALAATATLTGCASSDDTDASESKVTERVRPRNGNAAFDFLKPGWSTDGAVGKFRFGGVDVAPGGRVERTPGSYKFEAYGGSFAQGSLPGQPGVPFNVVAGKAAEAYPSALRIRFENPITLGKVGVVLSSDELRAQMIFNTGYLKADGTWRRDPDGVFMLLLSGSLTVTSDAESAPKSVRLREGFAEELVLPTTTVGVTLDVYDAAYPTPIAGTAYLTLAGGAENELIAMRDASGRPIADQVVPLGDKVRVSSIGCGSSASLPVQRDVTTRVTLSRLEVDDVEVSRTGGGTQLVRGTYTVERKGTDGRFQKACNDAFPTHTGLDLPAGTYRIVSTAPSNAGPVTQTDEVTLR